MAREPAVAGRNPWLLPFSLAVACLAGSLVALAVVLFDAISDGETNQPGASAEGNSQTPTTDVSPGLTYAGTLPAGAAGLGMRPVAEGKTPDIEFASIGPAEDEVPVRYLVPVASLGAGVDSLTSEQLRSLLRGETTDWSAVGGIRGAVHPAMVDSPATRAIAEWVFAGQQGGGFANVAAATSYDALRASMTVDSSIVAIVPIEELRPNMVAIAIDGMDIARGVGDPAAWPLTERLAVIGRTGKGKSALEPVRSAVAAKLPAITRVVATGDVLQSRCSLAAIEATGDWAAALRGPVAEYLAGADLALSSLDGSIQGIGAPFLCVVQEYPNLTSPPEVIEALTLAGIDEMTLATNHAFDCGLAACGAKALLESQSRLNAAGIKTVGGGKDLEDALAPAVFEVNGIRIGVLGFDDIAAEDLEATDTEPGTAPLDDSYANERADLPREPAFYKPASLLGLERFQQRIRDLKSKVDVVIVQVQSGTEDTHAPSPRSIKALRAAADAGADLVVGNQAHWVQAIEVRNDRFVAYALGNFIFDQTHTPEHTQGYLLEATFHDKRLATVRMVPYQIENKYKPAFVTGATRAKVLGDVIDASGDLPAP
ncbi:MAG: CapA family protein [Dehalococcoidia bacterium]|jgi:poly-gamma-glutamate capsule biosynthesis protein CapA/YwtB (metallophosphatase superfamily)